MARQAGEIKITGTIEHLTFYKMYGAYFVRMKSSLTTKRFWKDRAFEGSRRSCNQLARASALASLFYRSYPKEKRKTGVFNEMTGRVKLWLKEGKSEEEALLLLKQQYQDKKSERRGEKKNRKIKGIIAVKRKESLFSVLPHPAISTDQRKMRRNKQYCLRE